MRVSYSLGSLLSVGDVLSCADTISRAHADTVWVPETWGMECFSMLGALSQRLREPRLGSSIINAYSRSPALAAMGAVTADLLSGGRLILGIGASSAPIVEGLHGIRYEAPLARVREYVEVVRLAASGARVDHDGRFFRLRGFRLLVRPARERIPVYVAAVGPAMLGLASELADGVILYLRPLAELGRTAPELRRRSPRLDVACQIIAAVSEDAQAAADRAKKTIAFYVCVGRAYREFLARSGYAQETADLYSEYCRTREARADLVPDAMLRELAVAGTPDEARSQLRRFTDAGITHPILQFNPVGDAASSFELLASAFQDAQ